MTIGGDLRLSTTDTLKIGVMNTEDNLSVTYFMGLLFRDGWGFDGDEVSDGTFFNAYGRTQSYGW